MTVVVVVIVVVLVVPVGVAVVMIFMVPVALVILPTLVNVIVVRMGPVGSRKRRTLVMPCDPTIVMSLGRPEALYPGNLGCGRRRGRCLVSYGWRRKADVDRNL